MHSAIAIRNDDDTPHRELSLHGAPVRLCAFDAGTQFDGVSRRAPSRRVIAYAYVGTYLDGASINSR